MADVHIGIDLDNTIIDYEDAFATVAERVGLLPAGSQLRSKAAVKTRLRELGGEEAWMRLQGQLYGRYIEEARLQPGVETFLSRMRAAGVRMTVISHKTRHGHFDAERVDLWQAARDFLDRRGFFATDGFGFAPGDVVFEETRAAKVARIAALGCTIFIDDLPEVLLDPAFPAATERLWYAPDHPPPIAGLGLGRDWLELVDIAGARI